MRRFIAFIKGLFEDMDHGYSYDKEGIRLVERQVVEARGDMELWEGGPITEREMREAKGRIH